MSGILSDVRAIIKIIQLLRTRKDVVIGNQEKCRILIARCLKFQSIIERIEKYKIISTNQQETIRKLKDAMTESLALIEKFCEPGWFRLVINVTSAAYYNQKFRDINTLLSECSSDLQLDIGVSSRIAQEEDDAILKDDHILLMKIYEMLKINNVSLSTSLRDTLTSPRNKKHQHNNAIATINNDHHQHHHDADRLMMRNDDSIESIVSKVQHEVPSFHELSQDTEMFLETIYMTDHDRHLSSSIDEEHDLNMIMMMNNSDNNIDSPSSSSSSSSSQSSTLTRSRSLYSPSMMKSTVESVRIDKKLLYDISDHHRWRAHHKDIIGRGSFGIVYKGAYDHHQVAIKVIQGYNSGIPSYEKRMIEREIYILAKCHHTNIIRFIGCDMDDGLLLTELALTNLFNIIYNLFDPMIHYPDHNQDDQHHMMMKLEWLQDIANGLQYLHFYDIIHRDLKPRNILLSLSPSSSSSSSASSSGDRVRLVAKITDFGVSTVLGLSSAVQSITGGAVVGTTSYKAPELFNTKIALKERYSKAVDIYAFGVLANELLSGELPWAGYPPDDVIIEVRDGGRPTLFKPSSSLSYDMMEQKKLKMVMDIIGNKARGCFAKDRTRRPEASKITEDLEMIISGQVVHYPSSNNPSNVAPSTRTTTPSKLSSSLRWINSTIQAFRGNNSPASNPVTATNHLYISSSSSSSSSATSPLHGRIQLDDDTTNSKSAKGGDTRESTPSSSASPSPYRHPSPAMLRQVQAQDRGAFFISAKQGDVAAVAHILDTTDIDINITDKDGWTALIEAATLGRNRVVQLLVERGADIHMKTNYGYSALLQCCREGHIAVVTTLLDAGADVDGAGFNGVTPLLISSANGRLGVVKLLISRGANVNCQDKEWTTPLISAARYGHHSVVALLVDAKAKIEAVDKGSKTAYDWAMRNKRTEIASLLKSVELSR